MQSRSCNNSSHLRQRSYLEAGRNSNTKHSQAMKVPKQKLPSVIVHCLIATAAQDKLCRCSSDQLNKRSLQNKSRSNHLKGYHYCPPPRRSQKRISAHSELPKHSIALFHSFEQKTHICRGQGCMPTWYWWITYAPSLTHCTTGVCRVPPLRFNAEGIQVSHSTQRSILSAIQQCCICGPLSTLPSHPFSIATCQGPPLSPGHR